MVRVRLRDNTGSPGWGWLTFDEDGLSTEAFDGTASDYDPATDGDSRVVVRRDPRLAKLVRSSDARAALEIVDDGPAKAWTPPSAPVRWEPPVTAPARRQHDPVRHVEICDVFGRVMRVVKDPAEQPRAGEVIVSAPAAAMTIPDEDRKRIAEAMAEANRKAAQQEAEAVRAESKTATPSDAQTQPKAPPPAKADDSPVQQSLSDTRIDSRGGRRSGRR